MLNNSSNKLLKFTIATVTFNAEAFIDRTIKSVEEQDYPYVEHLIVDGASKDATCDKVMAYKKRNTLLEARHNVSFLSEPDEGLYDAMNKALKRMTGHYILFLNAGDQFSSSSVLSQLAQQIHTFNSDNWPAVVYGHTDIVDDDGIFIAHRRLSPPEKLNWKKFKYGMLVCHQAFMVRGDIAKLHPYDLKYKYSSDYDWCIRIMKYAKSKKSVLWNAHLIIANFLQGGLTTKQHKKSLFERFSIMCNYYGFITTFLLHFWFLIRSQIKK